VEGAGQKQGSAGSKHNPVSGEGGLGI